MESSGQYTVLQCSIKWPKRITIHYRISMKSLTTGSYNPILLQIKKSTSWTLYRYQSNWLDHRPSYMRRPKAIMSTDTKLWHNNRKVQRWTSSDLLNKRIYSRSSLILWRLCGDCVKDIKIRALGSITSDKPYLQHRRCSNWTKYTYPTSSI